MARAFTRDEEELTYLTQVKQEIEAATTRDQLANIWKRHYLKIGHKKLGRLLLGQTPQQAMRLGRGGREE